MTAAPAPRLASTREWFDPVAWIAARGGDTAHLTYDPGLAPDYRIIRQSTHDGTRLFSLHLIARALTPLVTRTSFCVSRPPADWSRVRAIRYVVGTARVAVVYGIVPLPCGRYPGQRERVTVPVHPIYDLLDPGDAPGPYATPDPG